MTGEPHHGHGDFHDHGHDDHGHDEGGHHGDLPPKPHVPESRLPHPALLLNGLGLVGLAAGALLGAVTLLRKAGPLAAPLALIATGIAGLAAWGAAIELTGGEKFDDHKFV